MGGQLQPIISRAGQPTVKLRAKIGVINGTADEKEPLHCGTEPLKTMKRVAVVANSNFLICRFPIFEPITQGQLDDPQRLG